MVFNHTVYLLLNLNNYFSNAPYRCGKKHIDPFFTSTNYTSAPLFFRAPPLFSVCSPLPCPIARSIITRGDEIIPINSVSSQFSAGTREKKYRKVDKQKNRWMDKQKQQQQQQKKKIMGLKNNSCTYHLFS